MSLRKQYLPWMACALMLVIGVPALASGEERAVTPVDAAFNVRDNSFDDVAGGTEDHTVSITTGGKVTFSFPINGVNSSVHNADFSGGPAPAECSQTAAGPGYELDPDADPPLPDATQGPGWAGYCVFTSPGTYTFFCQAHASEMRGTVEVTGGTATPTPTATATVTATPTPPAAAARVDAHDSSSPARNWFQERGSAETDNSVTIKRGERVAFAYPTGANYHDVEFKTGPAPASCPQTKASPGMPLDPNDAPPLPAFVNPPGWEGYCTFANAGTYTFVCGAHPEMTGTVIVQDATPTPTASPTATASPTVTASPTASASPSATASPGATASPSATASPAAPPTVPAASASATPNVHPSPAPAPTTAKPAPKITAATFKRSKRTVTVKGTTSATGKVNVKLAYKVGKKSRTKSRSVAIKGGKFSGTLKLSAGDARKASKLSVTVSAAGTASAKKTVSVRK